MGNESSKKKNTFEKLTPWLAIVACIVGLISAYLALAFNKQIPIESLYWFIFALVAMIFPYVKEFKFKDMDVIIKDINDAQNSLKNTAVDLKNTATFLQQIKAKIEPTREELIRGYKIYLDNIEDHEEKWRVIKNLSKLYLSGMNMEIKDVKNKLKNINVYNGTVDNEFTNEYYKALIKYQKKNNLDPDGIFGYMTCRSLFEENEKKVSNASEPASE